MNECNPSCENGKGCIRFICLLIRWCEDHEIPFTYQLLKTFTIEILKLSKKSQKISHKWLQRFAARHNFSARKSRQLDRARVAAGASPQIIIHYFNMLLNKIQALDLTQKPQCVWNVDEKGWSKQQALQQPVLVTKGKPQVCAIFTKNL